MVKKIGEEKKVEYEYKPINFDVGGYNILSKIKEELCLLGKRYYTFSDVIRLFNDEKIFEIVRNKILQDLKGGIEQ